MANYENHEPIESSETFVPAEPSCEEFLLAEFRESNNLWRHTNAQIETAINFYITMMALSIPVAAYAVNSIEDPKKSALTVLPLMVALIVVGQFLIRRVRFSDLQKTEYHVANCLVRSYFANKDPHVKPYLCHELACPSHEYKIKHVQREPYLHKRIIISITLANGGLTGGVVASVCWLVVDGGFWSAVTGGGCASVAFLLARMPRETEWFEDWRNIELDKYNDKVSAQRVRIHEAKEQA